MISTTIEIDIPEAVLACLDLPPGSLPDFAKECLALELFREGRLASGTAAPWLGISKVEFLDLLALRGVPYIDDPPEELEAELAAVRRVLETPASGTTDGGGGAASKAPRTS